MGMSGFYKNLREKVGNDLIFMPSVAGIVRNERGEILLQNKGNGEKWSLPSGAIELGEAPAEAVVREVWEETGLFVIPSKLVGVFGGKDFCYQYPNGHQVEYIVFIFECIVQGGELSPNDSETAELCYSDPFAMPELALPYPKYLFTQKEHDSVHFDWDDKWLEKLVSRFYFLGTEEDSLCAVIISSIKLQSSNFFRFYFVFIKQFYFENL